MPDSPVTALPVTKQVVVIAKNADGHLFTVGPVYSQDAVLGLADELRAAGFEIVAPNANYFSASAARTALAGQKAAQ